MRTRAEGYVPIGAVEGRLPVMVALSSKTDPVPAAGAVVARSGGLRRAVVLASRGCGDRRHPVVGSRGVGSASGARHGCLRLARAPRCWTILRCAPLSRTTRSTRSIAALTSRPSSRTCSRTTPTGSPTSQRRRFARPRTRWSTGRLRTSVLVGLWESANRQAHEQFVRTVVGGGGAGVSTEGGVVRLGLRPILVEATRRIGLGESLAARIPADAGTIEVLRSDELKAVQDAMSVARCGRQGVAVRRARSLRPCSLAGPRPSARGAPEHGHRSRRRRGAPSPDRGCAPRHRPRSGRRRTAGAGRGKRGVADRREPPERCSVGRRRSRRRPGVRCGARRAGPARDGAAAVARAVSRVEGLRDRSRERRSQLCSSSPARSTPSCVSPGSCIFAALAGFGIEALRRQALREFPEVERTPLVDWLRARWDNLSDRGRSAAETARSARAERAARSQTSEEATGGTASPASAPADPRPPAPSLDDLERLERLGGLHKSGVLTDEEFATMKTRLVEP